MSSTLIFQVFKSQSIGMGLAFNLITASAFEIIVKFGIIISSENEKQLNLESFKTKSFLDKKINAEILGPVNAPIYRIRKKFRNRILIRSKKNQNIQKSLNFALKELKLSKGIKLIVDVDPITFN